MMLLHYFKLATGHDFTYQMLIIWWHRFQNSNLPTDKIIFKHTQIERLRTSQFKRF